MLIKCQKCNYEWDFKGNPIRYAVTCPYCRTSVAVKRGHKRYNEHHAEVETIKIMCNYKSQPDFGMIDVIVIDVDINGYTFLIGDHFNVASLYRLPFIIAKKIIDKRPSKWIVGAYCDPCCRENEIKVILEMKGL